MLDRKASHLLLAVPSEKERGVLVFDRSGSLNSIRFVPSSCSYQLLPNVAADVLTSAARVAAEPLVGM